MAFMLLDFVLYETNYKYGKYLFMHENALICYRFTHANSPFLHFQHFIKYIIYTIIHLTSLSSMSLYPYLCIG